MSVREDLRRVKWLPTVVGAVSGALFGFGFETLVVQGNRINPWILGYGPLIGIALGLALALLRIPRRVQRAIRGVVLLIAIGSTLLAFSGPASAQAPCSLELLVDGGDEPVAGVSDSDPIVVDLSDGATIAFDASAPGTTGGAFSVGVVSADAGLYFRADGEQIIFYGPVSGDSAFGEVDIAPSGLAGFRATFGDPEQTSPVLPYGTLRVRVELISVETGRRVEACSTNVWIRVVATPMSNNFGRIAFVATLLGLAGLAGASSLTPTRPTPSRTGESPTSGPPSDGPFLEPIGASIDAVRTQLVSGDRVVDPGEPLIVGEEYRLRLTLRPGSGGGPVQVSTPSGPATDAYTFDVDLAEPRAVEFPLQALEEGRHSVSVDVTSRGHLLHTERISATATDGSGLTVEPASTESVFSLGDLSVEEIEMKPPRSLLVVLESDKEDGTVDVRVRDGEGRQLVFFDSPLPPAALSAASSALREAFQSILEAGPGRQASVDPQGAERAIIDLAKGGRALYKALFPERLVRSGRPEAVVEAVRDGATVQIVQNKSGLGYTTLPWALVYDRVFTPRASSTICGSFRTHDVDECPHAGDSTVACPTGFWGFRSRLEEPWIGTDGTVLVPPDHEALAGGLSVAYLNEELGGSALQSGLIEQAGFAKAADLTELLEFFDARAADLEFLYFYTHHTIDSLAGASLDVAGEELSTLTFDAVTRPWARRPVVMINACGSGSYSLTDSMSLVEAFRYAGAAGLVTTECELWDPFAAQLATRIIGELNNGKAVGSVLLDLRRDLIRDHSNPVGFAYRLHALADTGIAPGGGAS